MKLREKQYVICMGTAENSDIAIESLPDTKKATKALLQQRLSDYILMQYGAELDQREGDQGKKISTLKLSNSEMADFLGMEIEWNEDSVTIDYESEEWWYSITEVPELTHDSQATTLNLEISQDDLPEFIGQILDTFDDFLEMQNVRLPHSEQEKADKEEPDGNEARLYGSDYDELYESLHQQLRNWAVPE